MRVTTICTGALMENCHIVSHNNSAVIIDPGADAEQIINAVGESCSVKYILLTHGHFDHIGAVNQLLGVYRASVMAYSDEVPLLEDINCNLSAKFGTDCCVRIDYKLSDGEYIPFEGNGFTVIHTPGHTAGSCCFLLDDIIFTGDTLFYLSVGRTDFPTGSFKSLIKSLNNRLAMVKDNCIVYPGHGNVTEMGFERLNNPYFKL